MKLFALTAGLVLAVVASTAQAKADSGLCRVICGTGTPAKPAPHATPVPVKPAPVKQALVKRVEVRRVRHVVHPLVRHYVRRDSYDRSDSYYSYREAESVTSNVQSEWHGKWYAAPNDAMIAAPAVAAYAPPVYAPPVYQSQGAGCECGQSVHIDASGWTGGVGYAAAGGVGYAAAGGFVDGYGMMHYAGGSFANGPTYNSYRQSFQFNGGVAGSFQPRMMGGFAPRR